MPVGPPSGIWPEPPPVDPPTAPWRFGQTPVCKGLVRDVADGTKSVQEGLIEAFAAGVDTATNKEPLK